MLFLEGMRQMVHSITSANKKIKKQIRDSIEDQVEPVEIRMDQADNEISLEPFVPGCVLDMSYHLQSIDMSNFPLDPDAAHLNWDAPLFGEDGEIDWTAFADQCINGVSVCLGEL